MASYSTINYIYFSLEDLINVLIEKEWRDQGHVLTGQLIESLSGKIAGNQFQNILEGYAAEYALSIEHGISADKINWGMYPAVTQYFVRLGYEYRDAQRYAQLTIIRWMKEGMPTEASSIYSKTGERIKAIENALNKPEVDAHMSLNLDIAVEEAYRISKDEII